jgi:hypothetical protein
MTVLRISSASPKIYALDGPDRVKVRLELKGAAERIATVRDL